MPRMYLCSLEWTRSKVASSLLREVKRRLKSRSVSINKTNARILFHLMQVRSLKLLSIVKRATKVRLKKRISDLKHEKIIS